MGSLPASRVTASFPFSRCGVDYTGPIYIKSSERKNSALIKSYVCLFLCFVTKAVHIELVNSLFAKDFLLALKRFTVRRGIPAKMYSDNSKTLVGAQTILNLILNQIIDSPEIKNFLLLNKIEWKFTAPYSPHLGGVYKAEIKSFKRIFRLFAKNKSLTFQEAETITIQIEGILNSRPLTPISSDPHDLEALTPGHFLIGGPTMMLPFFLPESHPATNLTENWKIIQKITQGFWTRWSNEYLQELQRSKKWHEDNCNLKEGTLVILKDPGLHPTFWKLARVMKVKSGKDGKTRIAIIKTSTGVTTRAITELCPLLN